MGYDLLNEPIAPYEAEKLDELNAALEPLYMRITKAIRKVDQNHIVMLGGAQWNGNFTVFKDSKLRQDDVHLSSILVRYHSSAPCRLRAFPR